MKIRTVGFGVVAAAGLAALSTAPATAAPDLDCADFSHPVQVSPADPNGLDADGDGIGCDSLAGPVQAIPEEPVADNGQEPAEDVAPSQQPQVEQVPVGGADTGVRQDSPDNLGLLALGGGLALATTAGGTILVRRRNSRA